MAPAWGLLLAYLLGFLLFQAVVYWYLQGEGTSLSGATPDYGDRDGTGKRTAVEQPNRLGADRDGVRCLHCGAYNERAATITYCRECVGELR